MTETSELANQLAHRSVVTKALGIYLHQILEELDATKIKPLESENARFRAALEYIASSVITTSAAQRARAALGIPLSTSFRSPSTPPNNPDNEGERE